MIRIIFSLFFICLNLANSQIVTYKDILKSAFDNNYELKNSVLEKDIAVIEKDIVSYGYLPDVSLGYNFKLTKKDRQIDTLEYRQYRNSFSVDIVQKVNYFEQFNRSKIATYDINLMDLNICDLRKKLAFEVLEVYSEFIKIRKNIEYFNQINNILIKIVEQKQKLFDKGIFPKNEVIKSNQELLQNKIKLNEFQLQHNIILNIFLRDFKYVINDTDTIEILKTKENLNLYDIKQINYINELKNYILQLNKNSLEVKLLKSQLRPNFELYFNKQFFYENEKYSNLKFVDKNALDDYTFGFNIRFSFNDFFIYEKKIERKKIEALIIKNKQKTNKKDFFKKYEQSNNQILNLLKNKNKNKKLLFSINNELMNFEKLNESGLEYKFKVYELQLKQLKKEIELYQIRVDIIKNYKKFEILFEKGNICTLH